MNNTTTITAFNNTPAAERVTEFPCGTRFEWVSPTRITFTNNPTLGSGTIKCRTEREAVIEWVTIMMH